MSEYKETEWVDRETKVDAQKMNNIENGISKHDKVLEELNTEISTVKQAISVGTEEGITAGEIVISDPSSNIYATCNGNGKPYINKYIESIGAKTRNNGDTATIADILCKRFKISYYPYNANIWDTSSKGTAEISVQYKNDRPIGIVEYFFARDDKDILVETFTHNNVLCIAIDKDNINDLKIAFKIENTKYNQVVNGEISDVNGKKVIVGEETISKYFVALTGVNINQYNISATEIDTLTSIGAECPKTISASTDLFVAAGYDGVQSSHDKLVFFISIEADKQTAINNVCNADYKTLKAACISEWDKVWANTSFKNFVKPEFLNKVLMSLHQIYSQSFNGFITAGVKNWYENYLRDTGWVIKAMSHFNTDFTKQLITWFCARNTALNVNSYTGGGEAITGYNNTDNTATLLIGITEYYKYSGDLETIQNNKTFIDSLLAYAKDNFNSTDNHIVAKHPHDFWDDYTDSNDATDYIDISVVKYESMVDVLWAYALKEMAYLYTLLNDNVNYTFCINTSNALINALSDFRLSDGGLSYALKSDKTKITDIIAAPGNLYMAWLFNDEQCKDYLKSIYGLRILGSGSKSVLYHHFKSKLHNDSWFPYVPIAIKALDDIEGANILLNSFNFGALPEYIIMDLNRMIYGHHAPSFCWSHASLLELASN